MEMFRYGVVRLLVHGYLHSDDNRSLGESRELRCVVNITSIRRGCTIFYTKRAIILDGTLADKTKSFIAETQRSAFYYDR